MTTLVPIKTKSRLTNIAAHFSKQVEARLAEMQHETQSRLGRDAAEHAQRVRERKAEEKRQAQWLGKRMPLARIGLDRVLAVGTSEPVQEIISDLRQIQQFSGVMMFYEAHRFSGRAFELPDKKIDFEPGTRDVEFLFYPDHLRIFCGSHASGSGITWEVFYRAGETEPAVLRSDPPKRDEEKTVKEFLKEIASPYPSNMALAHHWRQRRWEWEPEDIAFQLLVSCARPARLDNYLKAIRPAVPV